MHPRVKKAFFECFYFPMFENPTLQSKDTFTYSRLRYNYAYDRKLKHMIMNTLKISINKDLYMLPHSGDHTLTKITIVDDLTKVVTPTVQQYIRT